MHFSAGPVQIHQSGLVINGPAVNDELLAAFAPPLCLDHPLNFIL